MKYAKLVYGIILFYVFISLFPYFIVGESINNGDVDFIKEVIPNFKIRLGYGSPVTNLFSYFLYCLDVPLVLSIVLITCLSLGFLLWTSWFIIKNVIKNDEESFFKWLIFLGLGGA